MVFENGIFNLQMVEVHGFFSSFGSLLASVAEETSQPTDMSGLGEVEAVKKMMETQVNYSLAAFLGPLALAVGAPAIAVFFMLYYKMSFNMMDHAHRLFAFFLGKEDDEEEVKNYWEQYQQNTPKDAEKTEPSPGNPPLE